ncbi:MAG: arsenic metallochaperone ArsD family protein [Candidatus Desulforudaceae bacterium]
MRNITIFDPAMCCSTGLCGASPNRELMRVAADLKRLGNQGVNVKRFNLSQEPQAFVADKEVQQDHCGRGDGAGLGEAGAPGAPFHYRSGGTSGNYSGGRSKW